MIASNLDVTGTDGDDTFFASAEGDFRISGGSGFDTIDYSQLDVGITLNAPGTIDKGTIGTDTSRTNDRIIAPLGQVNTLDGTTNGGIPDPNVSIQPIVIIDLSKNALTSGTSPTSLQTFEVVNFNRVIGEKSIPSQGAAARIRLSLATRMAYSTSGRVTMIMQTSRTITSIRIDLI
jgi:hypothetical protein